MPTYVLLLAVILACLICGDALARPPGSLPAIDQLVEQLELDEDQALEFRAILEVHHDMMRSLAQGDEFRAERRALRQQTDIALQQLLTAEQFAEFRSHRHRPPRGQAQRSRGEP